MDSLDLSTFFRTKSEAEDFVVRLSNILEQIFETDFNLDRALMEQFGIRKKDKLITLLRDNNVNIESNEALKDYVDKIQKMITELPVLSLKIAFEPNEKVLEAVTDWLLLNTKKQFLVDINVDRSLIAGTVINLNGKFMDFSLKSRVDKIITDSITDTNSPENGNRQNVSINASQEKNMIQPTPAQ